jgi:hypothetical protein
VIPRRRWAPPQCCCVFPVFHRAGRDLASRPNHRWASCSRPCSSVRKMASPPRRRASPGALPHGRAHARVLDQAVAFVHLSRAWRTRPRDRAVPTYPLRLGVRVPDHPRTRSIPWSWPPQLRRRPALFHRHQPLLASAIFPLLFPRRKIQSVAATALLPLWLASKQQTCCSDLASQGLATCCLPIFRDSCKNQ